MKLKTTILGTLTAAILFGHLYADPYIYDSNEWTKIVIKEAFISRQTNIDFRDTNSAPEFGWHLRYKNRFMSSTGNIYGTLYAPAPSDETVRLMLVERDVFDDDIVGGINLKQGKYKYSITNNGDFVLLEKSPFYPDKRSGADRTVSGAKLVTGDFTGSVSFLQGDYTDYIKLPKGPAAVMIITSIGIGKIDSPSEKVSIYPPKKRITRVYYAASDSGKQYVRIRGKVGRGKIKYKALFAKGENYFTILFNKTMRYLNSKGDPLTYFIYKDIARAFLTLDKEKTISMCGKKNRFITQARYKRFCTVIDKEKRWIKD